jgi:hypothetical protein
VNGTGLEGLEICDVRFVAPKGAVQIVSDDFAIRMPAAETGMPTAALLAAFTALD